MSSVLVLAIRILEGIFVVGAIGCVAVLLLTAVEDVRTLFGLDDDDRKQASSVEGQVALDPRGPHSSPSRL